MKKILIILISLFIVIAVQGQEKSKKQKLTREEKKELKKQQKEEAIQIVDSIISAKQFVLEANLLRGKSGQSFNVDYQLNFIKIVGDKAICQFGSATLVGENGFGGVTLDGVVKDFKANKNEKSGSYFIRMVISTTTGFYDISMDISPTGIANAIITAISNNKITYYGSIVPLDKSSTINGISY